MGKKVRKRAGELGLTKLRMTILYARPRKMRMIFSKYVPDTADAIRDYVSTLDPSFVQSSSGGGRNNTYYYLAPQANLYVEVADKATGFALPNPANHAIQINIFSDNDEHIREIADAVNQQFADGILAHMDWKKTEKNSKSRGRIASQSGKRLSKMK